MLRSLSPASPNHRSHDDGDANLPSVHVSGLGGNINELIHRQQDKVHANVHMDWPEAGEGRADRETRHAILSQRRVEATLRSEFFHQTFSRTPDRFEIIDTDI